jgi:hypothetical protein
MSTDAPARRERSRRRTRAFAASFGAVVAVLSVVGVLAATASVAQGPRVTDVQVAPAAAVVSSGSRVIFTTSQSLAEVDASQVTVEPATPFAVDTSGRSVGVRFAQVLRDDTEYTVTIDGLTGIGGGPASTATETFRTPPIEVHLLQRGGTVGDDTIFRTDLAGARGEAVFRHPHIEDYRATASHLVISVRDDEDRAALIVTDLNGEGARELTLPGDGFVSNLQAADRGEVIGYTFSDADLSDAGGRESALFTASLAASAVDDEPTPIEVEGADPRIAEWRFVPDTDSILLLTFDGSLLLTAADGSGEAPLGTAISIDGIAGTTAIVERPGEIVAVDLTDGSDEPIPAPPGDLGMLARVAPVPGGGSVRTYAQLDADGLPTTVALYAVDAAATEAVPLLDVDQGDALLQTCVSPSGRYVAALIAPDAASNPYDQYLLPMPERLLTHIVEIDDGTAVSTLEGFDISWCRVPPA